MFQIGLTSCHIQEILWSSRTPLWLVGKQSCCHTRSQIETSALEVEGLQIGDQETEVVRSGLGMFKYVWKPYRGPPASTAVRSVSTELSATQWSPEKAPGFFVALRNSRVPSIKSWGDDDKAEVSIDDFGKLLHLCICCFLVAAKPETQGITRPSLLGNFKNIKMRLILFDGPMIRQESSTTWGWAVPRWPRWFAVHSSLDDFGWELPWADAYGMKHWMLRMIIQQP